MDSQELRAVFDQMAPGYDKQWAKMAPIRDGLHFVLESVFAALPQDARVLCVGVGTGVEIAHLAQKFPGWRFMAVDPSGAMLAVCRGRATQAGFLARCEFHEGYVESLPPHEEFDGATCFLVSQFILEREARTAFFREIARRLRRGGILASSDLAAEAGTPAYEALLEVWLRLMAGGGIPPDGLENMRRAYSRDVAVLAPATVAAILEAGGLEHPVQFYQAGLIHAWFSRRS